MTSPLSTSSSLAGGEGVEGIAATAIWLRSAPFFRPFSCTSSSSAVESVNRYLSDAISALVLPDSMSCVSRSICHVVSCFCALIALICRRTPSPLAMIAGILLSLVGAMINGNAEGVGDVRLTNGVQSVHTPVMESTPGHSPSGVGVLLGSDSYVEMGRRQNDRTWPRFTPRT